MSDPLSPEIRSLAGMLESYDLLLQQFSGHNEKDKMLSDMIEAYFLIEIPRARELLKKYAEAS